LAGENNQEKLFEAATSGFADTIMVSPCQFSEGHSTTLLKNERCCNTNTKLVAQYYGSSSRTEEVLTASQERYFFADLLVSTCLSSCGSPAVFNEEKGMRYYSILVANDQNEERV